MAPTQLLQDLTAVHILHQMSESIGTTHPLSQNLEDVIATQPDIQI